MSMQKSSTAQKIGNTRHYSRQELGKWGEELAAALLLSRGFAILNNNYHTPDGEIDLIAKKGDELIFVEVKTRRNTMLSYPEEAINDEKIDHLENAAGWYLLQHPEFEQNWRLDVITVIGSPNTSEPKIDWFENVTAD